MDTTAHDEGLSRRTMIRGAVAGGAVAWSAPTLLSLGSAAAAASNLCTSCPPPGPRNDPGCNPSPTGPEGRCGASGPFDTCSCLRDFDTGECFCHEFVDCSDPRSVPDPTTGQCQAPYRRAYACCDGSSLRCYPPCGFNA